MKKALVLQVLCWLVVAFLFTVLSPVVVHGQTPKNPSTVAFTASADHTAITKYVIGYFLPGGQDPVTTADLGKPTPDTVAGCGAPAPCIQVTVNTMPLSFAANYTAKVKAVAGTAESAWSEPSNPFDRVPGPPSKPVVK